MPIRSEVTAASSQNAPSDLGSLGQREAMSSNYNQAHLYRRI